MTFKNKLVIKTTTSIRIICYSVLFCFICTVCSSYSTKEIAASTTYPYLIKVNKLQNYVIIYEKDKNGNYSIPIKAMTCSVGTSTPEGTFKTPVKYEWRLLVGNVWGMYATRIVNSFLFHSVPYNKKDPSTLSGEEFNKLGTTASHGCIRLTVEDAKWIYDNCPIGTTVTIYSSSNREPLEKPEIIKIPEGEGWDPTDITNGKNPYNKKNPTIQGLQNQSIPYGTSFDILKGITAFSTTGTEITSQIKTTGRVNTKKAGIYKVQYEVMDLLGRKANSEVTYTILESNKKPTLEGISDRMIDSKTKVNRKFALEGVIASDSGNKIPKKNIKVKITTGSAITYKVNYYVTGKNNKTKKASAIFTIKD